MKKEAMFFEKKDGSVRCTLCPRECVIQDGKYGVCRVRKNEGGKLHTESYSASSLQIDPIEKKPLFHFLPGENVFSFGTCGCNLKCEYCQNWEISQGMNDSVEDVRPSELIDLASSRECKIIAATYNEPTIFFEYMHDVFKLAKEKGMKTVVVSNGFINQEPLKKLIGVTDAFNIDLKSIEDEFYKKLTKSSLEPVLRTIKTIKESGRWMEVTNLVIPKWNDSDDQLEKLCSWIKENIGEKVPVHFSAFFPTYKLLDVPPTDKETLEKAYRIAKEKGIRHIYQGNLSGGKEDTFCSKCGELLVKRDRFFVLENRIKEGRCPFCSENVEGIFV